MKNLQTSVCLTVAAVLSFLSIGVMAAGTKPMDKEKVLVLSSYHQGYERTQSLVKAVVTAATVDNSWSVDIEWLDLVAQRDSAYMKAKAEEIMKMHQAEKKRAVVLFGEEAWIMWRSFMSDRWHDVPCVALFSGSYTISAADYHNGGEITDSMKIPLEDSRRNINATFITDSLFIGKTIGLGLQLRPETRHIAVITNTWQVGYITRERIRTLKKGEYSKYDFIDLNSLSITTQELEDRLKSLPENTITIFDSWNTPCGTNRSLYPDNAMRMITGSLTHDVVFGLFDYGVRESVLTGGVYPTNDELHVALINVLHKIGSGTPASSIPLTSINKASSYLNYRNLKRNGVDERLFPDDAIYYGKPVSFIEQNQLFIIAAFCIAILLVIIAAMLTYWQHQKKKDAARLLEISRKNEQEKVIFISSMSNIMRSPLNTINMFLDIITDPGCTLTDEEKRLYAEQAKFNDRMLLNTFNDIIEMGELNMKKMKLYTSDVDLESCLLNIKEMLKNGEDIYFSILSDGTPHVVKADMQRLHKALAYTIKSAAYFKKGGMVTVELSREDSHVTISIGFEGVIRPEDAECLFDLFSDRLSRLYSGRNCLEMPLCRELIVAMGGTIRLTDHGDGTSAFVVTMPVG